MKDITIVTHEEIFHVDETLACALVKLIEELYVEIDRIPYQSSIKEVEKVYLHYRCR